MAKRVKLLAFDTSSTACSVGLLNGDEVSVTHKIAPMQQAHLILSIIQEMLDSASLSLNQLDAVAFGCGPGSFTGIRIASSVAQGIGFGANLPLVPISSLAAIAQTAYLEQQLSHSLVAIDARMKQVYWAGYEVNTQGLVQVVGQEQVCLPEDVSRVGDNQWCGLGDGWGVYKDRLVTRLGYEPSVIRSAELPGGRALLMLGKAKFDQGEWVAPSEAKPVYLR